MSTEPSASIDRVPPHNLEAEESVLGSMILSHAAAAEAQEIVRAEDFYKESHREIFRTLVDLYSSGSTTDPVVLAEELKRRGRLESVGDRAYIVSLVDTTPNPHNIKHYCRIVRDMAIRRSLIEVGWEITDLGYGTGDPVENIFDRAEDSIFGLGKRMRREGLVHIREPVKLSFDRMSDARDKDSSITGVPTGFYDLDHLTRGLQPSNLIVIGGRTSMGKTSLALNIASHAAVNEEIGALVFSLEMSRVEVAERLLLAQARVDSRKYKIGKLDEDEMDRVVNAAAALSNAPIYIDDTGDISIMEMRTIGRQLKAKENIGLMIVDYMQLMYASRQEGLLYRSRVQEVSKLARDLKVIAMDLEIPVIAVSQLRRPPPTTQKKAPSLEDLKESGGIEQNADVVVLIYRPEVDDPRNQDLWGKANIDVAKHRNGMTRELHLNWIGSYSKFENPAEEDRLGDELIIG